MTSLWTLPCRRCAGSSLLAGPGAESQVLAEEKQEGDFLGTLMIWLQFAS